MTGKEMIEIIKKYNLEEYELKLSVYEEDKNELLSVNIKTYEIKESFAMNRPEKYICFESD